MIMSPQISAIAGTTITASVARPAGRKDIPSLARAARFVRFETITRTESPPARFLSEPGRSGSGARNRRRMNVGDGVWSWRSAGVPDDRSQNDDGSQPDTEMG